MSVVFPGCSNITISPGGPPQYWIFTWNDPGWQGITILQPQPLFWRQRLDYSETTVVLNQGSEFAPGSGQYGFVIRVTNPTNEVVTYNIQTSWFP
jgi:hypothetical protein